MPKNTGRKFYKAEFLTIDEVNGMLHDLIKIHPTLIDDMQKVMDGVDGYEDLLDINYSKIREYVDKTEKLNSESNKIYDKIIDRYGESFAERDHLVFGEGMKLDIPKAFSRDLEKRRRLVEAVIRAKINNLIARDIKSRVWDMYMGTEADGEKLN